VKNRLGGQGAGAEPERDKTSENEEIKKKGKTARQDSEGPERTGIERRTRATQRTT
jgi:hypothetical protein